MAKKREIPAARPALKDVREAIRNYQRLDPDRAARRADAVGDPRLPRDRVFSRLHNLLVAVELHRRDGDEARAAFGERAAVEVFAALQSGDVYLALDAGTLLRDVEIALYIELQSALAHHSAQAKGSKGGRRRSLNNPHTERNRRIVANGEAIYASTKSWEKTADALEKTEGLSSRTILDILKKRAQYRPA